MMRARAEKVERSFQHLLDHGGGRRTTLRGHHNIGKRLLAMAFVFNVALFRRNACGYGTVKQHLAGNRWMETFLALMRVMWTGLRRLATASSRTKLLWPASPQLFKSLELLSLRTCARSVFRGFSTVSQDTGLRAASHSLSGAFFPTVGESQRYRTRTFQNTNG